MAIDFTAKNPVVMSMDDQITISVIGGAIALTALLVFLCTLPINMKLKQQQKRLDLIRSVNLSSIASMEKDEQGLKSEDKRVIDELGELEVMLSQQKDVSNLIDAFVDTAAERNLTFDSLQPLPGNIIKLDDEEEEDSKGRKGRKSRSKSKPKVVGKAKKEEEKVVFSETIMQIELSATFNDFLAFLWETENLDKTLRVKYLTINNDGRPNLYKYNVVISVLKYLNYENK